MRITFKISSDKGKIEVPLDYNHPIQSLLYHNISSELASFLHDKGFSYERRSFKMFTFSRLIGRYDINDGRIIFETPVKLIVSSPIDQFVSELANTILRKGELSLCGKKVYVEEIIVHQEPDIRSTVKIRTMTPIVVYSTLITTDKKKKTYYYNPIEREFSEILDKNLRKKYEAFYGKNPPKTSKLSIKPLGRFDEKIVKYRDNVIKGYMGRFILEGDDKLIKLAYDCGLGSKNSQGFGMFDLL